MSPGFAGQNSELEEREESAERFSEYRRQAKPDSAAASSLTVKCDGAAFRGGRRQPPHIRIHHTARRQSRLKKSSARSCAASTCSRIRAATIELSIPPDKKHPSGTSDTSCRATACCTQTTRLGGRSRGLVGAQRGPLYRMAPPQDASKYSPPIASRADMIETNSPGESWPIPL